MKRLNRFLTFSFILAVLASCVKEEVVLEDVQYELTAKMEMDAPTRTSLSGLQGDMYYPLWSAGDELAVFVDGDASPSKFTLKSGEGATKATFAGTREGSYYYALYPFSDTTRMENGAILFTLPSVQEYMSGSFGIGSYPMVAYGASETLNFKNLCAVMKISIRGDAAVRSITLQSKDEEAYLSGKVKVNFGDDSSLQMQILEGGSNSVTLDCKGTELAKDSVTDFHFVIPAQSYKGGFDVIIDAYSDTIVKSVASDLEFKRSSMRHLKGMELEAEKPEINYDAIPDNEIWYVTSDGNILDLASNVFDQTIMSNTYLDGKGVIKLSGKLQTVKSMAFSNLFNLKFLVLPNSVETLEDMTFLGGEVDSLYIPSNLKNFTGYAFSSCTIGRFIGNSKVKGNGRFIVIGDTLKAVSTVQESELIIPECINVVGSFALGSSNPNIKKVIIEEGVEVIEPYAFIGSRNIEEVYLPESLKDLQNSVFDYCDNIRQFHGPAKFVAGDGRVTYRYVPYFDGYGSVIDLKFISNVAKVGLTDYTIDADIKGIDPESFCRAYDLKSLTINTTSIYISGDTFDECYNLESIIGPGATSDGRGYVGSGDFNKECTLENAKLLVFAGKGISEYTVGDYCREIGSNVFAYQRDLRTIKLDDGITRLGSSVFYGSQELEEVVLPASLQYIGIYAFYECPNLKNVYLRSSNPPSLERYGTTEDDIFYIDGNLSGLKIYVPEASVNLYKSTFPWSRYASYILGYKPDYNYYISTDYTQDGTTVQLQKATEGNGINIVLMGDGYSDRQIADGSYKADMEYVYSNLFTKEPYKSYKHLFNVSYVNVVSATEGFEYGNTALSCGFGDGTYVYGNDNAVFKYAQKVVDESKIDETLMIVVMNSNNYAGTCFMYYPNSSGTDYGKGPAVAYFPKGESSEVFAQLLHHEANGHGFAKLADEYAYDYMGTIPSEEVENTKNQQSLYGWWKNVDFTNDPAQVRWKQFLEDSRYANEGLGVFEGGLTYWSGVWRPTENSIMRYNQGEFNAPSREAIYYRMHKLAYGADWKYNYEKFVEYDAVNYNAQAAPTTKVSPLRPKQQLHPPVVVKKSWREAGN